MVFGFDCGCFIDMKRFVLDKNLGFLVKIIMI